MKEILILLGVVLAVVCWEYVIMAGMAVVLFGLLASILASACS